MNQRQSRARPWTRPELLAAFELYCRTPFGKLHQRNPEIVYVADLLGRTPSAVAMKACNFASLDPSLSHRVRGLGNASEADRALWAEFLENPEKLASEIQRLIGRISQRDKKRPQIGDVPEGPTEVLHTARARRVQAFFRAAVLASYEYRCALTGLAAQDLLNASHIIPWRADAKRRADPSNGICLNVLHDRAFDRGLISFDDNYHVAVSRRAACYFSNPFAAETLQSLQGKQLRLPERFLPDPVALAWHRSHVFLR